MTTPRYIMMGAAGNIPLASGSIGIFTLGEYCNKRNKYTYATDGNVLAVSANTTGRFRGAAAGNSTRGIFALGATSCGNYSKTEKYTYATNSVTAGTNNVQSSGGFMYATGNATRGIFTRGRNCVGAGTSCRSKYTYSGILLQQLLPPHELPLKALA